MSAFFFEAKIELFMNQKEKNSNSMFVEISNPRFLYPKKGFILGGGLFFCFFAQSSEKTFYLCVVRCAYLFCKQLYDALNLSHK